MKVVHCDDSYGTRWNAFLAQAPHGSLYHRFEWKRLNEEVLGHRAHFLAAVDGGEVRGVFPVVQLKSRLFGNIACSMPFVNYGGPSAHGSEAEQLLLDEAERLARELRLDYLEIRSRRYLGPQLPSSEHKVSMTVDLSPNFEDLWRSYKTGHRQDIRRAQKYGFVARFGGAELVDGFYEVLTESWRSLGTPLYQKSYFRTIVDAFGEDVSICVVFDNDEPAAAAFYGYFGDTVEGMWLGTKAKYRKQLAGYVLYWEIIKHGCERGCKRFHLGRSTADSTGETFKKKWNASATPLYWHYVLGKSREIPGLNTANPRYQLAMAAWRKLPVGIIQRVGPLIARCIP